MIIFFFYRNYQRVYKPGFVSKILIVVIHLESLLLNFSSDLPKKLCRNTKNVSSIWSCSKWGLPCHFYHQKRGALLPHHFTLTKKWRYIFCGTFPRVTPAGCYPALYFCRARTFLCNKTATTQLSDILINKFTM